MKTINNTATGGTNAPIPLPLYADFIDYPLLEDEIYFGQKRVNDLLKKTNTNPNRPILDENTAIRLLINAGELPTQFKRLRTLQGLRWGYNIRNETMSYYGIVEGRQEWGCEYNLLAIWGKRTAVTNAEVLYYKTGSQITPLVTDFVSPDKIPSERVNQLQEYFYPDDTTPEDLSGYDIHPDFGGKKDSRLEYILRTSCTPPVTPVTIGDCQLPTSEPETLQLTPETVTDIPKSVNAIFKYADKKVSVLQARKGAKGFIFDSTLARKAIKHILDIKIPYPMTDLDESPKEEFARLIRRETQILQKVVKAIYPDHARLPNCGRDVISLDNGVTVMYDPNHKKAWLEGEQTCGHGFGCPSCAVNIAKDNQERLEQVFDKCREKGYSTALLTLTIRHRKNHTLEQSLDYLIDTKTEFYNSKPIRNLNKRFGRIGDIQILEVTWTEDNGWHPHCHVIFIFEQPIDLADFRKTCVHAWITASNKIIKAQNLNHSERSINPECIDLKDGQGMEEELEEYLTKQGLAVTTVNFANGTEIKMKNDQPHYLPEHGKPKVAKDLVRNYSPKKDSATMTPNDFLRCIAHNIEEPNIMRYAHLYREFIEAMHGKALVKFSPNLEKKLFSDDPEPQAEEPTEEELKPYVVAVLTPSENRTLYENIRKVWFLEMVENTIIYGDYDWRTELDKICKPTDDPQRVNLFEFGKWRQYDPVTGITSYHA